MRYLMPFFLLLAFPVFGANYYFSQNSTGSGSGSDTNNLMSIASVNSSFPAHAGDTMHLCGTLTNNLTVGGSGTAGNPITFYFEPNAKFSAPTLANNSIWLDLDNRSYIVVDGGINGVIELTDNGTVAANGGTKTYGHYNIGGISANPINRVTVQNLTIQNMYFRQTNTEYIIGTEDGFAIHWSGSGMTVSNCLLASAQDLVSGGYSSVPSSNLLVTACVMSNWNHCVTLGVGDTPNPIFYNVTITHNKFLEGDMFETPDGQDYGLHRNAMFFFNEDSTYQGTISNIVIAYNFIHAGGDHPLSHTAGTGVIFCDVFNNTQIQHMRIYNNISTVSSPLTWSGTLGGSGSDILCANNTMISWLTNGVYADNGGFGAGGTNAYSYNNISLDGAGAHLSTRAFVSSYPNDDCTYAAAVVKTNWLNGVWSDYNIYNYFRNGGNGNWVFNIAKANQNANWSTASGGYDTWAQYQTLPSYWGTSCGVGGNNFVSWFATHCDPHGTTNLVQLTTSFQPMTNDTVAIGNGTNLTAWGITDDYAGNPRPATGNWTIGAYQAAGTTVPTTIPAAWNWLPPK